MIRQLAALSTIPLLAACVSANGSGDPDAGILRMPPTPTPTSIPTPVQVQPAPTLTVTGQLTQGGFIRGTLSPGARSLTFDGEPLAIAADGSFFAAFDRDAELSHTLVAKYEGETITRQIAITPREWDIEHVNVARSPGGMTDAFWKIREPEWNRIVAAREKQTGATGWMQDFVWPVKGRISGTFGSQRIYRGEPGSYHSGIDIATGESGTTYVAPADGVVILATKQPFSLEGYLLMIDHGNGLNSAFLHNSAILVKEGDAVKRGQPIGRIGATGRATGPHLHWSIKWRDTRLDPILFTGAM